MEDIIKMAGAVAAISIFLKLIITMVSTFKLTRFERIFMTEYKKTFTILTESFVITFVFSVVLTLLYQIIEKPARLEEIIAFFLVVLLLLLFLLWLFIHLISLFVKKKIRFYYFDSNGTKLYIHKLITESEVIVSESNKYDNDSVDFKVIKKEDIYGKNIGQELI